MTNTRAAIASEARLVQTLTRSPELVRRVDPQCFDPQTAERVAGDVEREQLPAAETAGAIETHEQRGERDVPQRLAQERGW